MPTGQVDAPRLPGRSRMPRARSGERGSVSVETMILLPLLFLFMFLAVQGGLWFHARSVALGAAQEGARVAGAESSSAAAGAAAAASFVADAGGEGVLLGASTTGSRNATTATVTVTGEAQSVIPGWTPGIVQSASVPVERVTG
ncbi:TadE/TadG family type IV pilus assembly protein [Ornithinimicrobium cavernae]|uniref:TadE/TadG family type IV pilus assembly protein n=1 Tax=Ornithinimicrobium cavernae TaxID=2666047 RepID=UPI001F167157|nr:TadE/TadG family type IV pilus assembly protein [Ornithinimicrobium cavernae]